MEIKKQLYDLFTPEEIFFMVSHCLTLCEENTFDSILLEANTANTKLYEDSQIIKENLLSKLKSLDDYSRCVIAGWLLLLRGQCFFVN